MTARGTRSTLPEDPREWHRRVWSLSWPVILANLSIPLVGAVDTAVVGHLPDPAYIGAVAIGAVVLNFLYFGLNFLRMGTSGLVAQAFGAGDIVELRVALARALLIATGLGLAMILAQAPIFALAFSAMQPSEPVEALAGEYYRIRIWGAPAALINMVVLGLMIGLQRTRLALLTHLTMNVLNIVLDLLFVLGFGWGVAGVAAATLIGEYGAAALGLWLSLRALRPLGGDWQPRRLRDLGRLRLLVALNANIFVRTLCVVGAMFWFAAVGTRLGDVTLAANAVLLHFQQIMSFGLDGLANSAEALAGSAYGSRKLAPFRTAVRVSFFWALVVAACFSLFYALAGGLLIGVLTGIDEVRQAAGGYLPWVILLPLISVWAYHLDGIYIATTHTREMRNSMLLAFLVFLATIELTLPWLGNHGLWLAMVLLMVVRAATLLAWYPRIEAKLR